jgi:hypothetical protein
MTMEEWRNSPESFRNKPKLTEAEAQRIADEAIAGGQKWDVQEKINARRFEAECGGGLGKISAPAKLDALVPTPRCQAGAGAFGTYFVHPSEKYGIKLFRNGDEDDVGWESDRLDRARAAGVNVPAPLAVNAVRDQDGDIRAQTLVLSHMRGYKTIDAAYPDGYGNATNAPLIIQVKLAREYRKLHIEGMAHGDIHNGNTMVHVGSKKVALIDFGYSTSLSDFNPHKAIDGVDNLVSDLRRLPRFLGFSDSSATDFVQRHSGVIANIRAQADNYSRDWEKFELGVNRYHDALERELLWDDRKSRSSFVSGADQPRIPGLTRRILTANANTKQRKMMEFAHGQDLTLFGQAAQNLGVKPARLFLALKPEREARERRPFGTPIPLPRPASSWKD